jgi:hypothetical protein
MTRKIIDEAKRTLIDNINKANTPPLKTIRVNEGDDFAALLSKTIEILRREIAHLLSESVQGKLSRASSQDLVSYVKLLNDLFTHEKELLSDMDRASLEKANNDQAQSSGD